MRQPPVTAAPSAPRRAPLATGPALPTVLLLPTGRALRIGLALPTVLVLAAILVLLCGCARAAAPSSVRDRPGHGLVITSVSARRSASGRPFLLVRVRDTAPDQAGVAGSARLSGGPGGAEAGPFPAKRQVTLVPGHSARMTFPLPRDLAAGPWQARITVTSGPDAALLRTALQFPARARTWLRTYLVPVTVWLCCLLLALVIIGWVGLSHLRDSSQPGHFPPDHFPI